MTTINEIRAKQEQLAEAAQQAASAVIKWKDGFQLSNLDGIEILENAWHLRLENQDSYLEIDNTIYDRLRIDTRVESEDGQFVFIDATSGEYEDERYYRFILLAEKEEDEVDARLVDVEIDTRMEVKTANEASRLLTEFNRGISPTVQPKAGEGVVMGNVKGSIKLGRHTENHGKWLRDHGYTVEDQPGKIVVEGTAFVESLDLSGTAEEQFAALKEVIASKKLLTYSTKAKTAKGERSSIMLCTILGPASALVVKPVGKEGAAGAKSIFAAL